MERQNNSGIGGSGGPQNMDYKGKSQKRFLINSNGYGPGGPMGGYIDPNKQNQSQLKNELLKMYTSEIKRIHEK